MRTALLLIVVLMSVPTQAIGPGADPCKPILLEAYQSGDRLIDEVLLNFLRISRFRRGSGKEGRIAEYLVTLTQRHGYTAGRDKTGNIYAEVPATGRFAGKGLPPLGIQFHLDMVEAVQSLNGRTLDAVFSRGVPGLRVTNGILHSRRRLNTIGADNGIGMAIAMYLLSHPEIEHPPLFMIGTVQEETTFAGARYAVLPENMTTLINLDGETLDRVWVGALGSVDKDFEISSKNVYPRSMDSRIYELNIEGLTGGHSGLVIHENLGNSAVILAKLMAGLIELFPGIEILSFQAGQNNVRNVIPTNAHVRFGFSSQREETSFNFMRLTGDLENHLPFIQSADSKFVSFKIGEVPAHQSRDLKWTMDREDVLKVSRQVSLIPNGVLTYDSKYPHGVNLSSNIGFFHSTHATRNGFKIRLGVMARAFETTQLLEAARLLDGHFDARNFVGMPVRIKSSPVVPAWTPQIDSWLTQTAIRVGQGFGMRMQALPVAGTLEAVCFLQKKPELKIIVIGPNIRNPHSPDEEVEVSSIRSFVQYLRQLIMKIGHSPEFVDSCQPMESLTGT